MSHEIVKCDMCKGVISQCRCMGPHSVRYRTCDSCKRRPPVVVFTEGEVAVAIAAAKPQFWSAFHGWFGGGLLVLALLVPGCHSDPGYPAGTDCPSACARLRTLACLPDDAKTPAGLPCEEWYCKSDLVTAERAKCVSHAADCDVVNTTCRSAK